MRRSVARFLVAWLLLWSIPSQAQPVCDEPTDPVYIEEMAAARAAVDVEDFERALQHLFWASERFNYAAIDFSIARAMHRMERLDEAVERYQRFLARFEACADPYALRSRTRGYLNEIEERRAATNETPDEVIDEVAPPEETGEEVEEPFDTAVTVAQADVVAGAVLRAQERSSQQADGQFPPGWIVVSGGGALLLTALIYDLTVAQDLRDEREAAANAGDQAQVDSLDDDIEGAQVVEALLYGTALAAAITGTVMLIVENQESPGDEPSVGWSWSVGAGYLSIGGVF